MSVTPARGRQLSLFGVEARPPAPLDLEGLLAGAGQVGRMGGTGRVSMVVEEAWRGAVLRAECELRGLATSCEPTGEEGRWLVRTAYSAALAPLAVRWLDGVDKRAPAGLMLDGRRLRLWVAAAGCYDGKRAYLLRLAPSRRAPDPEPDIADVDSAETLADAAIKTLADARIETLADDSAETLADAPVETLANAITLSASEPGAADKPTGRGKDGRTASGRTASGRTASGRTASGRTTSGRRKGEGKITAFDPGPDEFADHVDDFVDAFVDDGLDEWPDSGVGDLPTVVLDAVSESAISEPAGDEPAGDEPAGDEPAGDGEPADGRSARTKSDEDVINRRVVDNWLAVGDALVAAGLPAVFVAPDAGGPAYRIVGPRRITRLAELVGEPPAGAPVEAWPR